MPFRFEKLYADLVTPDGTVCVTYFAWLDLWGVQSAFSGMELYWADGRREVIRARPRAERIACDAQEIELSLDVPGGPFVLRYEVVHGAWTPRGDPPCDSVRWCVKVARANAVGRWLGDGGRPELRGVGYADRVELERPARQLQLGALRWGRVHLPDASVVFDAVDFRSGRSWKRAARWSSGGRQEWDAFGIEGATRTGHVLLPGDDGRLNIAQGRVLHEGDAIDRGRFPGMVERLVSQAVTGPATEQRLLGRAQWTGPAGPASGWALREAVRFGPRAQVHRPAGEN
jgi:hypothetical protein